MNKPKLQLEKMVARLDVPDSNTNRRKHNRRHTGDRIRWSRKRKESVKKEIYVFYHPQFGGEIYAGDTRKEAQEMWNIESDSYKDSTDELGKIRKVVADVSQIKEI